MKPLANKDLVPHPHANVLSSDAFSRGLIKSGTDFSVYSGQGGMAGLDLAFYKGRSMYHTKYDGMQYTVGGEKSLWSMMEAARGIGIGLLRAHASRAEGSDDAVYFDSELQSLARILVAHFHAEQFSNRLLSSSVKKAC